MHEILRAWSGLGSTVMHELQMASEITIRLAEKRDAPALVRRRGIKLLTEAEEQIARASTGRTVEVRGFNSRARAFYARRG
jgi:hypothetical protein